MLFYLSIIFCFLLTCCAGTGPHTALGGIGQGSTKPYYCRGSWHYPQNYYEYDETGLASWYGPGFHGKPKPYGEAFNMHGVSAAHRTLPLPTVVRVTNLSNGKSISLVVDDRGPFVYEGRIIDLSVGAAKALGTYNKGLATVRVQSIPGESRALSDYLAAHGNKYGKMRDGRTWQQVYMQEIAGKYHDFATHAPSNRLSKVKQPKAISSKKTKIIDEVDQLLETIAPKKSAQPIAKTSYHISLNKAYMQKINAERALKSLPSSWNAKIQSISVHGQTFYELQLGPFEGIESVQTVIKQCKQKGFSQALVKKG